MRGRKENLNKTLSKDLFLLILQMQVYHIKLGQVHLATVSMVLPQHWSSNWLQLGKILSNSIAHYKEIVHESTDATKFNVVLYFLNDTANAIFRNHHPDQSPVINTEARPSNSKNIIIHGKFRWYLATAHLIEYSIV